MAISFKFYKFLFIIDNGYLIIKLFNKGELNE